MKKSFSKLHFFLQIPSSFVMFKKSSVLNLWTRTILGVIIKCNMEEGKKTMGHEDPDVVVEKPDETVKKNRKVKKR